MKSKLLLVMLTLMTCLLAERSQAQTRYQDSIFANYTVTTVVYSSVYPGVDTMDIYQPVGDTSTHRPTVILAHEGTFVSGTRTSDPTVVRLCRDLAHKGYVTVSIDYRLASNVLNMLDSNLAVVEVFQAISDGKAAIRYLHENASTYGLDTSNFFVGGNSAGAVLYMHVGYIDSVAQLTDPLFLSVIDTMGGITGNSGNPGYSQNFKGVINLAGGLNQAYWIGWCAKPVVSAQGSADDVVPYTCGDPNVGVTIPLQLCGLGSLQPYITANTPYSSSLVFPGQGHVPWDANDTMFQQVDTLVTGFLYKEVMNMVPDTCSGTPLGIRNVYNSANISLFPNPATNVLNIQSAQAISAISVMDETGRVVLEANNIDANNYQMNTSRLSAGIYFVSVNVVEGQVTAVRKVTIE